MNTQTLFYIFKEISERKLKLHAIKTKKKTFLILFEFSEFVCEIALLNVFYRQVYCNNVSIIIYRKT